MKGQEGKRQVRKGREEEGREVRRGKKRRKVGGEGKLSEVRRGEGRSEEERR